MSRRYVEQMRDGDSIDEVYLVSDKQLRSNRNGNLYVQIEIRDRTGGISARMWNAGDTVFRSFENGDFVQIDAKVQLFQGSLQVILNHVERAEEEKIDLADFMPHTERYALMEDIVLRINKYLGYDFNTVELAIRDDVPYAIDFCNPAPDAEVTSVGQENFEWVVETAATFAIEKAMGQEDEKDNLTWGEYVKRSSLKESLY